MPRSSRFAAWASVSWLIGLRKVIDIPIGYRNLVFAAEPASFTPWIRHFAEIGVLSKWWSVLEDKEKLQKMSSDKIVKMN